MDHRTGRIVFAVFVGLLIAVFSYRWITNPLGRENHAIEVNVVAASQRHLAIVIRNDALEIVDPLAPNRKVGKVYVYPEESGWSVSGYYRRNDDDRWHPYLMTLDEELELTSLKAKDSDSDLRDRALQDAMIELVH